MGRGESIMKHLAASVLISLIALVSTQAQDTPDKVVTGAVPFEMRVLTTGLEAPWELTWGPNGTLWVTERTAGRITEIDRDTGAKRTLIDIAEVSAPGGQDGLLGLALDPNSANAYTAYTYVDETRGANPVVTDPASPYHFLYTKIVRLTYDPATGTLGQPTDIIAGLPASNDHNSGRLKFGPDGKLYYTIGDGGKNQLGNWCIPIEAQRLPTTDELAAENYVAYQGKSLRLDIDGSIPEDNPVIEGIQSHVFTYGHRNMQGIDFAPDGTLYASEQGPKTDDEVNVLVPGSNYGWPHVAGFRDDMAYQFARWKDATTPCEQLTFSDITIDPSVPVENETAWQEPSQDPLATMFTVPSDWDFVDPACEGIDFICWPTVAASSIQTYMPESEAVPGWGQSLLVTSLKRGSLYRLPLSEDGQALGGPIERYFQSENRFRDTAIGSDMKTLYIATDASGLTESLSGGVTTTLQHPGSILMFYYTGADSAAAPEQSATDFASDAAKATPSGTTPLTYTAEQAARGKTAYDANCVSCHGPNLLNANYGPPLAGDYFNRKWTGMPVGDLLAKVQSMPPSRPNSLSAETYADMTAYILRVNELPAGDGELPSDPAQLQGMVIAP
jgi:PQQ-dependent dehydrogenase (s-GDH family)